MLLKAVAVLISTSVMVITATDERFTTYLQAFGREKHEEHEALLNEHLTQQKNYMGPIASDGSGWPFVLEYIAENCVLVAGRTAVLFDLYYKDENSNVHSWMSEQKIEAPPGAHWEGDPKDPASLFVKLPLASRGSCSKLQATSTAPVQLYATFSRPSYAEDLGWSQNIGIVTAAKAELTSTLRGRPIASTSGQGVHILELPGVAGGIYQGCVDGPEDNGALFQVHIHQD
ncbi:hypothetical protein MRB53_041757 [Persea americana]|nr:hypothetical protein MRB53_041757 [Persea americana]